MQENTLSLVSEKINLEAQNMQLREKIESLKKERDQLNNKLESIEKTFKDINGRCITAEQEKEQVKIFLIHFKF